MPHSPDQVDIGLAAAIPRRRTDRRAYSWWPVAPGDIALMAPGPPAVGSCYARSTRWTG